MKVVLSTEDKVGIGLICGNNEKAANVIRRVIDRQRGSIAMHGLALQWLSSTPTLTAYESSILPLCIAKAQGARITDIDGNEYIDCHMTATAAILGHNPAPVVQAIQEAIQRGIANFWIALPSLHSGSQ